MGLSPEIADQYRTRKGLPESFIHRIYGQVTLSQLTPYQAERMEKEGLLVKRKKRAPKEIEI